VLFLHRADRTDGLINGLVKLMLTPSGDPLQPEVVSVPTHGVERFVTQRLSHRLGATGERRDGVCANVVFPTPRRMVDEVVAGAHGLEVDADPWALGRVVWPLLDEVDDCMNEGWMQRLAAHLGQQRGDRSRRFRSVRHLAGLFDGYATHRPTMLRDWAVGRDEDGAGRALDAEHAWQAQLWRRLRDRVGGPDPVARVDIACERLADDPAAAALPARLSVFGLTGLPARQLQVLRALALGRDVHLFLLHPSDVSWQRVAAALADAATGPDTAVSRAGAAGLPLAANPLLASWADQARELQLVLARDGVDHDDLQPVSHREDTLLRRLQADVRADRAPAGAAPTEDRRPLLADDDASVQVHACHGRGRQVEVLRDAILHALHDDPTLEPRDIVVMCTNIETFAPLIEATFGGGEALGGAGHGGGASSVHPAGLHVRLADRALHERNTVLGTVSRLLALVAARATASEILDLADREPVRRRFHFGQDDMASLEEWVSVGNMRWGLDADHRAAFGLQDVEQGTWKAGLDRLLLGVALADEESRTVAGVLPLDDVDSSAIDLAGRFAEYLERLRVTLERLSARQPVEGWTTAIAEAAELLMASTPGQEWQLSELHRLLADVRDEATIGGVVSPALLDVADIVALLDDRLVARPTRANFRTGHLTVCTLRPMRTVPYRVVCLLGLDDAAFPRPVSRDGDDLLLIDPCVGDRDTRMEDRQILLDAVTSATDRLIITYTGNDERTNAEGAPAVPVGELLDVIDRTVRVPEGAARGRVVVRHPLQPFDRGNFEVGALIANRPWSFDTVTLAGARARTAERTPAPPFLAGPLPSVAPPVVELAKLVEFFEHPIRAFLRQRLGVTMRAATEVRDTLPIDLDGLERWDVAQRLLDARLAGVDAPVAGAAERARGVLPPGELGEVVLRELTPQLRAILTAARRRDTGEPRSVDINVALGDGRTLRGTVTGVCGHVLEVVTYSVVDARQRLRSWIPLLALSAAFPDRPFGARTIGRPPVGHGVQFAEVGPLADEPAARQTFALAQLRILVDLYDRGLREPLPLFGATSMAYGVGSRTIAMANARVAWTTEFQPAREDEDAEHRLVFGGVRPFGDIVRERPREDEGEDAGEGWDGAETTRFGRYARRLWSVPDRLQKMRVR
jgi:exodeoxyribonuclease V gamma subunit